MCTLHSAQLPFEDRCTGYWSACSRTRRWTEYQSLSSVRYWTIWHLRRNNGTFSLLRIACYSSMNQEISVHCRLSSAIYSKTTFHAGSVLDMVFSRQSVQPDNPHLSHIFLTVPSEFLPVHAFYPSHNHYMSSSCSQAVLPVVSVLSHDLLSDLLSACTRSYTSYLT